MAIKIETDFLNEVKRHIRVLHNNDDELIKNEIEVAILNIWTQYMLKSESDLPISTNKLDPRIKLAIKHLAATYRMNPDDHLETKYIAYNKHLIQNILGSQMGYFKEL